MDIPVEVSNTIPYTKETAERIAGLRPLASYQYADYQLELLEAQIRKFEETLDDESQIALSISNFGASLKLYVVSVDCGNPNLLYFYGYLEGKKSQWCELIQHVSQLNFLITAVPKMEPEKPRRPIGFNVR